MSGLGRVLKFIGIAIIATLFVTFCVANRGAVTISLFPFPYSTELPEFLLAIFCFVLGALVAGLLITIRSLKVRHLLVMERKKNMAMENELKLRQHNIIEHTLPALK